MYTIVLLVEKAVNEADAGELTSLHEGVETSFVVVLPEKADHRKLLQALDDVALGYFGEAAEEIESDPSRGGDVAQRTLEVSVAALRAASATAVGEIAPGDDPVGSLRETVARHRADEVIVLADPHLVEEFFHRDWTHRARHQVGVPVLRLYAHTRTT